MRGTGKGFSATGTTDEGSALSHRLLCLNRRMDFAFVYISVITATH